MKICQRYIKKSENYDLTTIRTSSGSHLHWKGHFRKKPLYFMLILDFEVYNEIEDGKVVGNRVTIIYKQNSMVNGYNIVSELVID